jgi:hypothetical protein
MKLRIFSAYSVNPLQFKEVREGLEGPAKGSELHVTCPKRRAFPTPHRRELHRRPPHARQLRASCYASLDELEPRPLYSEPELCGGRVEGDEQLAHRD